jgi:hypothetical protein
MYAAQARCCIKEAFRERDRAPVVVDGDVGVRRRGELAVMNRDWNKL